MFKHAYHGGPYVELLAHTGKNPLEKWKVEPNAKAITKVYDKEMKGSIFVMGPQAKL